MAQQLRRGTSKLRRDLSELRGSSATQRAAAPPRDPTRPPERKQKIHYHDDPRRRLHDGDFLMGVELSRATRAEVVARLEES